MNCTFRFLLATLATSLAAADPQLESWQTANTRRLSRRNITWEDPVWIRWNATAGVLLAE